MFDFLPQLLIIVSIAGILFIVLRKTPEVRNIPFPELARKVASRVKFWLGVGLRKLWIYVLEVKEISKKGAELAHLPKFPSSLKKINFSTKSLSLFKGGQRGPILDLNSEGEKLLAEGHYSEAEQAFIQTLEKDPHNERAYSGLGRLYLTQKKFQEAGETYSYLVKHHPESDTYFINLGQAYHSQGLYDKAIEAYEKAIEMAPENVNWYINLGMSLEAKNHFGEAILNYKRAAEKDPENKRILMILADAFAKNRQVKEAEDVLQRILVKDPTDESARKKLMHLKF